MFTHTYEEMIKVTIKRDDAYMLNEWQWIIIYKSNKVEC